MRTTLMRRLLIGTWALALLVVASVAGDDEKKDKKPARPEAMFQELLGKYKKAETKDDRQELLKTYAQKFLDYAAKNPGEADAAQALLYVLQLPVGSGKDSPKAKAIAALNKDYVKSPVIAKPLRSFQYDREDAQTEAVVKGVLKENPDKTARAYAAKALIKAREQVVRVAGMLKEDDELRERFEKQRGKNAVEKLLEQAKAAEKEIKEYNGKLQGELKGVFPDLSVGAKAPEIVSQDLEGKKVKLSDLKGKVVVLDLWATWCPPCRSMIPHTRELVKKMDGKPFVFVSVSADAKKDTVTEFIKKTPMPWTHWWNGATGGIVEDWEIEAYPTIYVIDAKGIIRTKIESADNKALDRAVEPLVKEAEGEKKSD